MTRHEDKVEIHLNAVYLFSKKGSAERNHHYSGINIYESMRFSGKLQFEILRPNLSDTGEQTIDNFWFLYSLYFNAAINKKVLHVYMKTDTTGLYFCLLLIMSHKQLVSTRDI